MIKKSGRRYRVNTPVKAAVALNKATVRMRRWRNTLCPDGLVQARPVYRRFTHRQVDQSCKHPQRNRDVPNHVVAAGAVIQHAAQPDA